MDRERIIEEIKKSKLEVNGCSLKIIRELGKGGNGVAFLCKQKDQELVVKFYIPPDKRDLDTQSLKRFELEIKISSKTRHPNVIRAIDSGTLEIGAYKLPFYLMPLAKGTLRDEIKKECGVDRINKNLHIFIRAAFGVAWLHANKIVHRDLKPENVLISSNGSPWIADLGIAHVNPDFVSVSIKTMKAEQLLNRDYYAPEQRFGKSTEVDHRADIYALGCILYELLSGTPPVRMHAPALCKVNKAFATLDPIVEKMTAYEPKDRYACLEDALEDLFFTIGWVFATIKGARPSEKTDVPTMIQLIKSSNGAHKAKGIEIASTLGKEAINPLHELLGHNRREIRDAAATALGAIGDAESLPFLLAALYGNSNKPSSFRPSSDTADAAIGCFPLKDRLQICTLINRPIRPYQIDKILHNTPALKAYKIVQDLVKKKMLLLDYGETELQTLAKIDEERAWPDIKKLLNLGNNFKVIEIIKHISPVHQKELIDLWLDRGITDSWYFGSILESIVDCGISNSDKKRLLGKLKIVVAQFPRDFPKRQLINSQIESTINTL